MKIEQSAGSMGSTRSHILMSLRKKGGLSVNELAREVHISPMGVRQHLAILEKDGLVSKQQYHQPVGRPCSRYRLTERADIFFPKHYADFAKGILRDISDHEGEEKIALILSWRNQRMFSRFSSYINQEKLVDRARAMVKLFNDLNISCQFKEENGELRLFTYNCPIYEIAKEFPQICGYDKELLSRLLKTNDLRQRHNFTRGDSCCELVAEV